MTLMDFDQEIDEKIMNRGRAYFQDGNVLELEEEDGVLRQSIILAYGKEALTGEGIRKLIRDGLRACARRGYAYQYELVKLVRGLSKGGNA